MIEEADILKEPIAEYPELDLLFQEDELILILQKLIQHKSENPLQNEEGIGLYIRDLLEENSIKTEVSWAVEGRPNIYARLKGSEPGPRIIYNGHLDVVPAGPGWSFDPFLGEIKDGKLYGRGAADMKSGLAAMIYAAILLQRAGNPFAGEILLFFNSDEERTNLGMKKFLEDQITADYAVISEPTNLDICIGHRGCARYRVRTRGEAGHTSFVREPNNGIYKMTKLIDGLEKLSFDIKKRIDPEMGAASLTVSQIQGGVAPNIVPDFCEIEIDRRTLPGEREEEVTAEIVKQLDQISALHSFQYELECYLFLPASFIPKSHPFVKASLNTAERIRDKQSEIRVFEATCEAPFFSVEKGIPTVVVGPGGLSQAHVVDEYVEVKEVVEAARFFLGLIIELTKEGYSQ